MTAVLANKRWLQQVTSVFMNWLESNIEGVNKYLGLKGDKVLTLPNELARQNAKLRWQNARNSQPDEQEEPNEEQPQETISSNGNVQGNNPSTNSYNGIDSQDNNEQ